MTETGQNAATGSRPGEPGTPSRSTSETTGNRPGDTSLLGRYGLVRPREDRKLAGVCLAIARATDTDPVLWRVLMAVGVLFGGVGLLGYLVGWLIMPEEGDTGSPLEALFGRGRSSTSPTVTVLLVTAGVILTAVTIRWTPVAAAVIAGAGYLIYRQRRPAVPPGTSTGMSAAPGPTSNPDQPASSDRPSSSGDQGWPPGPGASGNQDWSGEPGTPDDREQPARTEFPDGETELLDLAERYRTGLPPTPPDIPVWPQPESSPDPPAPRVASPPRQPSALGRVAVFGTLFALGVVASVDLAGAMLGASAYLAAALAVTGVALLMGAWFGRARWLILLGVALSVALAVTTTTENLDLHGTGTQRWKPTSVAQIEPSYGVDLGDGNLDLRDVDFAGKDVTIRLAVNAGTMEVFLPQDLDLTADVRLAYGNVVVLGQDLSGASIQREISDLGADEATGPGQVDLQITVNAGNLEVKR